MRSRLSALAVAIAMLWCSNVVAKPSFRRNVDRVPNRYIVMFDDAELKKMPDLPEQAVKVLSDELVLRYGGKVTNRWHHAIRGFAAEMTEQQAIALLNDHRIKIVEEDAEMFLSEATSQWNLDRIDSPNPVRDGQYAYGDS